MHPAERHAAEALIAEAEKACRAQVWCEQFRQHPDTVIADRHTIGVADIDPDDGTRPLRFVAVEATGVLADGTPAVARVALTHRVLVDLIAQLVGAHHRMHQAGH